MRCAVSALAVLVMFAVPLAVFAAAPEAKPAAGEQPVVIRTLPGIVVDTKAREVRLEGLVCRQRGALELLVCSQGTREHESVVVIKAKPSHVTFALALLGLQPGKPGFATEGGAFSPPAGDVVDITCRFSIPRGEGAVKKAETSEVPAWKLLRLAGSQTGLDRSLEWVYVGLPDEESLNAADREGTVVCLSNFVEAVMDVPFESTSVNADLIYEANPDVVPPVQTPVELVIRPAGRRIEPRKVEIEVVLKKGRKPLLDGKPIEVAALKDAAMAMPADIRTAVLRADADETFGRVMEVNDILRDALMQVRLIVMRPAAEKPAPAKPAAPPLAITLTADDRVRIRSETMSLEDFRAKAGELLKGAERAVLATEDKASMKTAAEVMSIARDHNVVVTVSRGETPKQ